MRHVASQVTDEEQEAGSRGVPAVCLQARSASVT